MKKEKTQNSGEKHIIILLNSIVGISFAPRPLPPNELDFSTFVELMHREILSSLP